MVTTLPIRRCLSLRRRIPELVGVVLIALTSLAAYASGSAHQNFRNIMNAKVGASADSPSARLWRDQKARISVSTLPNGNTEEGYTQYGACRYYFEIDKSTRKIVGWRYEGTEQECVVVP